MSDILLFQTLDDGEIEVIGGIVTQDGGLPTSVYLSLFGGNENDDGVTDKRNWWGNADEVEPSREYRSETQNLLKTLPAVSSNLIRLAEAARRDLQWMIDESVATEIEAIASLVNKDKVDLFIQIDGDQTLKFSENWGTF